jgi:hypothetical protein
MMAPELRLGAYHRQSGQERACAASGFGKGEGGSRPLQAAATAHLLRTVNAAVAEDCHFVSHGA